MEQQASVRIMGSSDHGYYVAECNNPRCADTNGRPWHQMYSRRQAEGARLAQRDTADHNKTHHS